MNAGECQNSGIIKVCPVSFVLESRGVLDTSGEARSTALQSARDSMVILENWL